MNCEKQYLYCFDINVFFYIYYHIPNLFSKANTVFSELSKELIQDLDGSIALNKGFLSALRQIWALKL